MTDAASNSEPHDGLSKGNEIDISVLCFTGNSGLTDYSVSLCRELARRNGVRLLTARSINASFADMGFSLERFFRRTRHYPIDIVRLAAKLRSEPRHTLLFQSPLKYPAVESLLVLYLRSLGFRVGITIHDLLPHHPRPWSRLVYRRYYRVFDFLVVHSARAAAELRELGVETRPLVVPHGIYDLFAIGKTDRASARAELLGASSKDLAVLFFGHLDLRKGIEEFVTLAERYARTAGVRFLIAGPNDIPGRHGKPLLERARKLPNTVVHPGRVPHEEVEKYFHAADVVMLPYREGTTSGVLKLALAFGKPVIATDIGDIRENIPPGGGILVAPGVGVVERLEEALTAMRGCIEEYARAIRSGTESMQWHRVAQEYQRHMRLRRGVEAVREPESTSVPL